VNIYHEPITATDHGLDDRVADHGPQVAHVRAEQALAHHDPAPHGLDELFLSHKALGVQRQKLQYREWLSPELQLDAVLRQSFVDDVELKR